MKLRKSVLPARYPALGMFLFVALSGVVSAQGQRGTNAATGEKLFLKQCASCHGAKGEGTSKYGKALVGSQSVANLATFIAKSMPPGAKKKLPAADAQRIAAYIYDAFYSPLAQARNKPARVDLSRLTVRQYRNAVADLVGSFRSASKFDDRHGLRGEYYKNRAGRANRVLERVDPEIRFDYGTGTANGMQDDPYQFAMRWDGSVVPPETGEYEFIVKTEHAVRLWVNDPRTPLIDALVKSGSSNEYHETVFLLGGRPYYLALEFSKGVQGVNDLTKLKQKPPATASLSLEWKAPHRASEVIPERNLIPVSTAETFIPATPFPPDDRSMGYERGTSVSKEWEDATTEAALETAAYVTSRLRELSGVPEEAPDRANRLKEFCRQLVGRAFRRPLAPDLAAVFVDQQFQNAPDLETAVKRVVLLALKSPRFLYREITAQEPGSVADPYDVASRLSFGLWDTLPDQELLKAAAAGQLSTREQVVKQAERMVNDPRTHSKVRDFFLQWLKVEHYPDLAKDAKRYPGFDEHIATDLRASLEMFLDQVIWSERSDFRELLLSDRIYLNGRLAKFYGVPLPENAPFQALPLDPSERAGVLTHPYLLASFAYLDTSSPIHRGVLIARNMLGRLLQPPPAAFTPLPAEQHPDLTTRQRVTLQTKPDACAGCHNMINPLGFTLEKFDAIGKFRTLENNKPVDATGAYLPRSGKPVKFTGARDLANFLAGSSETHAAFVEKLFQHMVKQPVRAYGPNTPAELERAFAANQFSIRKQLVETMAVSALGVPAANPQPAPRPVTTTRASGF